jgi:hypothetical protein
MDSQTDHLRGGKHSTAISKNLGLSKRNPERIRARAAQCTKHSLVLIFGTKIGYEKRRLRSKEQGGRNLSRTG